jgi:hypothetical protein
MATFGQDGRSVNSKSEPRERNRASDFAAAGSPSKSPDTQPNHASYMEAVLDLYAAGAHPPGSVAHVTVYHEDGCGMLDHRGVCDCSPDVREGRPGGRS